MKKTIKVLHLLTIKVRSVKFISLAITYLDKEVPIGCVALQRVHQLGLYILAKVMGSTYVLYGGQPHK